MPDNKTLLEKAYAFIESINAVKRADHTLPEPYATLCMDEELRQSSIWNQLAKWSYYPCGAKKTEERKRIIRQIIEGRKMKFVSKETLTELRETYKAGMRVELFKMDDPYTKLSPGDKGTVSMVDDAGGIHINWDRGSTLAAIPGEDIIKTI